ncbi:hypothetical protein JHK87_015531 [Glycine soja]|nr:hypothetical protein JHK87_015531 [Glycine soja]
MRSVDVFKYCSFVTFGLSRDEAESWRPPMSIPELQRWFDDLVGLRSNLSQGWINRMERKRRSGAGLSSVPRFQRCDVNDGERAHRQLPRTDSDGGAAADEAVWLKPKSSR